MTSEVLPSSKDTLKPLFPNRALFPIAHPPQPLQMQTSSDPWRPQSHLGWASLGDGFLLPCLMGLKAILSKFSRNRGKAQRLLLKPDGQVYLRTGIKFVSVDLPSGGLRCLWTSFRFPEVYPPSYGSTPLTLPWWCHFQPSLQSASAKKNRSPKNKANFGPGSF